MIMINGMINTVVNWFGTEITIVIIKLHCHES